MGIQPAPRYMMTDPAAWRKDDDLSKPGNDRLWRDHDRGDRRDRAWNAKQLAQDQPKGMPRSELSPLSKKVRNFDKYSRKGGRWSWKKRPPYERHVVSLAKAEKRMEEDVGAALTDVEAVEAGLRYFDKIMMTKTPTKGTRTENAKTGDVRQQCRPPRPPQQDHAAERGQNPDMARGTSLDALHRSGYGAAPSVGNRHQFSDGHTTGSTGRDEAVARCMDLKLTLKQRLDNYDRHRGINLQSQKQTESSASPGVSTGREGLFAPAEGTALDRGSVSRIVSRSLGDAVPIARCSSTNSGNGNENGSGEGGDISGSPLRWRSWQGRPPRAVANTSTPRAAITTKGTRSKEKTIECPGTPPSRVVETNGHEPRSGGIPGDGIVSGGTFQRKSTVAACREACGSTTNAEKYDTQPSIASSPSSATAHRGGVPLVPRVASLPSKKKARDHCDTRAPRRTKDFDPDNLECVRRHEASVAERAQRTQRLRMEDSKRAIFRARPLPAFLGAGTTTGGCGSSGGSGCTSGGGGGGGSGGGASGGVIPDFITALEQDEEARDLIERIKKVNPRADIASVVLQSTSTTSPVTSWPGRNMATATATGLAAAAAVAHPAAEMVAGMSPSVIGTKESPIIPKGRLLCGRQINSPEAVVPSAQSDNDESYHPEGGAADAAEGGQAGSGRDIQEGLGIIVDKEYRGGGGDSGAGGQPQSLMGRMLGSGMLDRQREWAKARGKKVLESRRKAEEAKEQEGKDDIIEAGFSERSWVAAKMQHLRSLERQEAEEENREQLREARRRASMAKAQREREASERKTIAIAATLLAADAIGKRSRMAPTSRRGQKITRRSRPPRRSRSHEGDGAADITGDAPALAGNGQRSATIRRQELDGTGGRSEARAKNASDVENLSEEEFFRVAVEKIMERERLGGGDLSGVRGSENMDGGKGSRNTRKSLDKVMNRSSGTKRSGSTLNSVAKHSSRSEGRRRVRETRGNSGVRRQRALDAARATTGAPPPCPPPSLPRGGRGSASKARQRAAVDAATGGGQGHATVLRGAIGRNSSLLSLYEAQSVEKSALRNIMSEEIGDGSVVEAGDKVDAADYRGNLTRDQWVSVVSNGDTFDDVGDYPWSEEGRAWSRGGRRREEEHLRNWSRGDDTETSNFEDRREQEHGNDGDGDVWEQRLRLAEGKSRIPQAKLSTEDGHDEVFGDIDPPRRTATNHSRAAVRHTAVEKGEPWDDLLGAEGNPISVSPPHFPFTINLPQVARRDHAQTAGRPENRSQSVQDMENIGNASSGAHYNILSLGSYPHEVDSTGRPDNVPTRTTRAVMAAGQHQVSELAGRHISTSKGDLASRGIRSWSGNDNDTNVMDPESSSSSGSDGEKYGVRGLATHAQCSVGEGQWNSSSPIGGYGSQCTEGSARSPARLLRSFFDPATSSADKGRLKVRDPRYFDPCSMRRMPDNGGMVGDNSVSRTIGNTAGAGESTAHDTTGVTLLLGRIASDDTGGGHDGKEKVITVMFDRAKFNEEEAARWWALHHARITGDR